MCLVRRISGLVTRLYSPKLSLFNLSANALALPFLIEFPGPNTTFAESVRLGSGTLMACKDRSECVLRCWWVKTTA